MIKAAESSPMSLETVEKHILERSNGICLGNGEDDTDRQRNIPNNDRIGECVMAQGVLLHGLNAKDLDRLDRFEDVEYSRQIVRVATINTQPDKKSVKGKVSNEIQIILKQYENISGASLRNSQGINSVVKWANAYAYIWKLPDELVYLTDKKKIDQEEEEANQQQKLSMVNMMQPTGTTSLIPWNYPLFRERHLQYYIQNVVRPCREQLDKLDIGELGNGYAIESQDPSPQSV